MTRTFRFALLLLTLCSASYAGWRVLERPDLDGLKAIELSDRLEHPWGLAFLPDGRMLVTERPGRMRIVAPDGSLSPPLEGLPAVAARGQGGLLDVAIDPQFDKNRWVYWSYSEPGDSGSSTAVARGRLQGNALVDVGVIFRQRPRYAGSGHFGSRLVFARDGTLFVTLGERQGKSDEAQNPANHLGKIVRITRDGAVPPDNPFVDTAGAAPETWSLGHRNVQGAALHPQTGELWTHEHGPQGGDELNVSEAGRNYGWPVISDGCTYVLCGKIGEGTTKPGLEQPLTYWVPSIAPSGMAFLTSNRYPGWQGNLFVGALRGAHLERIVLDERRVVEKHVLLAKLGARIRDVRQGPDGWLYVLTDASDGRLIRLER
jgi:glucose/arabinose dehydrogenase